MINLFDNYDMLGAFGALIRIRGHVEAYTIGERLNDTTAVIHFEKASPHIKGLYQLINQLFAKNHLKDFEFINREQDLGIPGLRKAKESYYPDHMVEKYTIYTNDDARDAIKSTPEHRCNEYPPMTEQA